MHLLDPYGLDGASPSPSAEAEAEAQTQAIHAAEQALAQQAPIVEQVIPAADGSTSDMDPALHLQDAVTTWLDSGDAHESTSESADDEASVEPYAPLMDSGDQGI